MATGVLVVGIGRATRLLGYLSLSSKGYDATIRLGQATLTDDAEGDVVSTADAGHVTDADLERTVSLFRGKLQQAPSAVSAIKVKGKRAYARVHAGEDVVLAPRPIRVFGFFIKAVRRFGGLVDIDVGVECSTGTYVRALARDLGAELGVGGHLTTLRRTRVGRYHIHQARSLEQLARYESADLPIVTLDATVHEHFAWYVVDADQVEAVRNGRPLTAQLRHADEEEAISFELESGERLGPRPDGADGRIEPDLEALNLVPLYEPPERGVGPAGPVAVLAPGGQFLALYEQHGSIAKAVAVFAPARPAPA